MISVTLEGSRLLTWFHQEVFILGILKKLFMMSCSSLPTLQFPQRGLPCIFLRIGSHLSVCVADKEDGLSLMSFASKGKLLSSKWVGELGTVHCITELLLFQIILKEREEKKGRLSVDHNLLGADEEQEVNLNLTPEQSEELASQEGQKAKRLHAKVSPDACFRICL